MTSNDETDVLDDANRPVTFDEEDYEWDDPDGPPDGTYVAEFTEALDGPTPDAPRAVALTVYTVADDPKRVGHAVVRTGDVPELVPGERPDATVVAVEIADGRIVDVRYDSDLDEAFTGDVEWVRERVGEADDSEPRS